MQYYHEEFKAPHGNMHSTKVICFMRCISMNGVYAKVSNRTQVNDTEEYNLSYSRLSTMVNPN